jgi:hypothetical protein
VKIGVYFATWWERTMVFGVVVRLFGEVRERCEEKEERRESVSFYEYNNHQDCNSGALYIRLYCSIFFFKESYRESVAECFL